MCPSTILVPICARVPFQCQSLPGHPYGAHICPGSIQCSYVPICARAHFWCQYLSVNHSIAKGTCLVPICTGHLSGAHIFPDSLPVPLCAQAPYWCPYMPGHPSDTDMYLGTLLAPDVPGDPAGPYMFPVTLLVTIDSRAYMPDVPICDLTPFLCLYKTWHFSGAHICLGTLPVLICDRAPY